MKNPYQINPSLLFSGVRGEKKKRKRCKVPHPSSTTSWLTDRGDRGARSHSIVVKFREVGKALATFAGSLSTIDGRVPDAIESLKWQSLTCV